MTQEDVEERMRTTDSAISRLESVNSKNSLSINTLAKYAEAAGTELKIVVADELKRRSLQLR
ncbi:helix-turn-helix domain-containing protein [Geovibrio ferrireducens]|uniref:helix-turn-helix domain-containing protein n=1 Tax=Geovibrio ferrireducens TaxID=46201 RepID=UPI00224764BD|nr:helix-turn-helix transcriptional regulator [Geovibrio ferrireducens]